jgi:hypothetical protein
MPFSLNEARWWFGWINPRDLPKIAAEALAQGYDTSALRQLAGLDANSRLDPGQLFRTALQELGRPSLSRVEAGKAIARHFASEIVNGKISPFKGCNEIYKVQRHCEELEGDLLPFAGYSSEPETGHTSEAIIREARELLQEWGEVGSGDTPDNA